MLKKIIYSTSGLVLLGPIGAVTGFFMGNEADQADFRAKWSSFYRNLGALAKCDGKVNVKEIAYLKYLTEDVLKADFTTTLLLLDSFKSGANLEPNLKLSSAELQILIDFCLIDAPLNYYEYHFLKSIAGYNELSFEHADMKSHYINLQVEPFCDYSTAKKAYHKLAQQFHPDSNPSENATEKFLSIQKSLNEIEKFSSKR